jgi:hypothetical protein
LSFTDAHTNIVNCTSGHLVRYSGALTIPKLFIGLCISAAHPSPSVGRNFTRGGVGDIHRLLLIRILKTQLLFTGDRKRIISKLRQPSGLSLYGNYLYWTDRNFDEIQTANKNDGSYMQKNKTERKPRDISVFDSGRQPTGGPCEGNGGCAKLCLAVSGFQKR